MFEFSEPRDDVADERALHRKRDETEGVSVFQHETDCTRARRAVFRRPIDERYAEARLQRVQIGRRRIYFFIIDSAHALLVDAFIRFAHSLIDISESPYVELLERIGYVECQFDALVFRKT